MSQVFRPRRCILFFPATRPDRYEKAVATGADAVCVDLEDAVDPNAKDEGRAAALELVERIAAAPSGASAAGRRPELILRINDPADPEGRADLNALRRAAAWPDAVMIPKTRSPDDVRRVDDALTAPGRPAVPLLALIETAPGLSAAEAIATASPRLHALVLGGVDLSAELGCTLDWEPLLYARSRVVHAAALAGIDTIDMPFLDVADPEGLSRESRAAARLGFRGKVAIHPTQVAVIQEAFSPRAEEIERARRIVAAYEAQHGGVLLVDGKLVDRPVVLAALRVLASARILREKETAGEAAGSSGKIPPP